MKKKIPTFLAGVLTTAILGSLAVSALAASGALTIEVNPINVQVNGQTFQPKDAQGASVPVFAYNGTTYAPLRALAEAYGLEVGYDAGSNMATVGAKASDPATTPTPDTTVSADYSDWTAEEEAAYQEFKGMWEVSTYSKNQINCVNLHCYSTEKDVDRFLTNNTIEFIEKCCHRFDCELYEQYKIPEVAYFFHLRGPWGWVDRFSSDGWLCGYRALTES